MFLVRGWDREETENTDPTPLPLLSNVPSVCVYRNQSMNNVLSEGVGEGRDREHGPHTATPSLKCS